VLVEELAELPVEVLDLVIEGSHHRDESPGHRGAGVAFGTLEPVGTSVEMPIQVGGELRPRWWCTGREIPVDG